MSNTNALSYQAMMNLVHQTHDQDFDKQLDYAALMQTLGQGDEHTFATLLSRIPKQGLEDAKKDAKKQSAFNSDVHDARSAASAAATYLQGYGTMETKEGKSRGSSKTASPMTSPMGALRAASRVDSSNTSKPSSFNPDMYNDRSPVGASPTSAARSAANNAAVMYMKGWGAEGASSQTKTAGGKSPLSLPPKSQGGGTPGGAKSAAGKPSAAALAHAMQYNKGWGQ
ncbi:hypothetical protein T484DRAFT_1963987 [Baffinella frigidus]|nr:hypothetical protein T484DRAFT_1963987 [Cryptophyta sp. CCMP2293]|mmetsp:Transcript_41957/g.99576  ORF Transcript_41957/g.99576 Transcript_41957/m.99576 type:complete len:227 (-) Transcript_41957:217-897(-)|eukprot:CAMPEP_0180122728 /NCGR_PEP_ID=MMETSP0986-20121125/3731_1 /TAXON_ID=697907 /ORGANISM="non described non described, Strain CCMP2293" /LENGTH=226 /DNA_ID=CAMNT_0022061937 /DNA_START=42 /DNA_END=722 /DNA_ORIENTATION=+